MKAEETSFYKLVSNIRSDHKPYFQEESIQSLLTLLCQKEVEIHHIRHHHSPHLFGLDNFEFWWLSKNHLRTWQETRLGYLGNLQVQGVVYELTLDVETLTQFFVTLTAGNERLAYDRFFQEFERYAADYNELSIVTLQLIGYWSGNGESEVYPAAGDFLQESPYPGQQEVVAYLQNGYSMPYITLGYSTCRICGMDSNGSQDLSDGKYMWPEGLAHYVECHNLRLPEAFEAHIASDWEPIDTEHLWMGELEVKGEWWKSFRVKK